MSHSMFLNMVPGIAFLWVFVYNFTAYVSGEIIGFIFNLIRYHGNENSAENESFHSNFDGFEEKQSLFNGFEENLNLEDRFEEKQRILYGFKEKQSIVDEFEEKQSMLHGFEEKQSFFNGFEEKQSLVDRFDEKQSILDGFEKKQSLFNGFEGKQHLVSRFEENHDLVDGFDEKQSIDGFEKQQSIIDGFVEKHSILHGLEEEQSLFNAFDEKHDLVDGFKEKQSILDGFEGKQSTRDGFEEKQSIDYVENGGNRGKKDSFVRSSKYEFLRGKDISGFIKEPKFESFTLLEFYAEECIKGAISELFLKKTKIGEKAEDSVKGKAGDSVGILEKRTEDSVQSLIAGETPGNQETEAVKPERIEESVQIMENREDVELETEDSVFPEDEETFNSNDFESISRCDSEEEEEEEEEEDDDDFDYKQLKMQLQSARRGGLPTIAEESEFSKMVELEQLQPLKMEEKLEHKDQIAKIQKVYRTYLEKMKKLDILNSQTTHAIGLLRLTSLVGQNSAEQSSVLRLNSRISKKIWPFKQGKHMSNRAIELIRDLELVYVGQMCLSWEILRWQHDKTLELIQYDPHGTYRYNQVAEEFQLFQVLVNRFLENEPFQDRPRVQNYARNRCLHSIFLQIPVIKGSKGARVKEEDYASATSSVMLKEIMEESMQAFWEFLRRDKDETSSSSKAPQQRQVAPQDPLDLRLLMNVRGDLEKKEKRVKEMIRSECCIVKKLKKHQRTPLDHPILIAQVELKLVSRVLNMSKLSTDHLVWCHDKLEKMKFWGRKLEVEPSILLFPC